MSKVYDVNRSAVYGGSTSMYYLKETLKSAGWAVSQSSDGSTLFSSSDGITTDAPGAGGMDNDDAWYFIVDPVSERGFTAQRGTGGDGDRYWRVRIANDWSADGIVGSTISTAPTPIDVAVHTNVAGSTLIIGSGSSDCEKFFNPKNSFKCHVTAFSASHNSVYGFYSFCSTNGTANGSTNSLFAWDPFLTGSTPPEDLAPWVSCARYVSGNYTDLGLNYPITNYSIATSYPGRTTTPSAFMAGSVTTIVNYGMGGSQYIVSCSAPVTSYLVNHVQNGASNNNAVAIVAEPFNGNAVLAPLTYYNTQSTEPSNYLTFRGLSWGQKLVSNAQANSFGRMYPDTNNLSTNATVVAGCMLGLPWPEGITPIS